MRPCNVFQEVRLSVTSKISPIPAFSDNYIWLLENADGSAIVVDPGESQPVEQELATRGLRLTTILITHHHFDHVGGVEALKAAHGCEVYGPDNPDIAGIDNTLAAGDRIQVGDYAFRVLEVPGHTLDHIAYFQADPAPLLFCGDTLFAGGCGRMFEGNPPMMHNSLSQLAELPGDTAVYCAHEYTLANLAFAQAAEPDNAALKARASDAAAMRERGEPTVPSNIALERATNPFLRTTNPGIHKGLQAAGKTADDNPATVFASLRAWKDSF